MCSNLHITPFSLRLKIPVGPEKPDHIRLSVFLSILPPTSLSFFHPTIIDIRLMIHLWAPRAMLGPMLSVKVHALSGHLCDVTLHPAASVDDLHRAIFVHTNIRIEEQRLFVGESEMPPGLPLSHYQSLSQPDSSRELRVSLVRRHPLQAQWLSSFRTGSLPWVALGDAPVSIKGDKEVVLAAVVQDGKALQFASPELRADKEVALAAVNQNAWALEWVPPELRGDREVVLAAVAVSGRCMQFASPELQADRQLALVAAHSAFGNSLQWCSHHMEDKEVVMATVGRSGSDLALAIPAFKADRDVVSAALQADGMALEDADPVFQADKEMVLLAVQSEGEALRYASQELRADKEVVMAAAENDAVALQWSVPELRADREVIMTAIHQNCSIGLQYAAPELRADKEIALTAAFHSRRQGDSMWWTLLSPELQSDPDVVAAGNLSPDLDQTGRRYISYPRRQ